MNRGIWSFITIIVLALGFIWYRKHSHTQVEVDIPAQAEATDQEAMSEESPREDTAPAEAPSNPEAQPSTQGNFAKALSGLPACLQYKSAVPATNGEPTLDNWLDILRNELGETVLRSEDWANTEIKLPNGEKRRIRVEVEMTDDDRVVRRLKYSTIDKEELPVPINLPPEQTEDPNDTFIASLEKEGEVTLTEKAERIYFQDGSEVFAVQRNNVVSEIEINKSGASYRCWNLDKANSSCECL